MLNINSAELEKIIKQRCSWLDSAYVSRQAEAIIKNTDQRLEPNIIQWMNGQEITDLWIGKYCINAIMSIRNDNDFLSALEAMDMYLKDEPAGIQMIWRTRK